MTESDNAHKLFLLIFDCLSKKTQTSVVTNLILIITEEYDIGLRGSTVTAPTAGFGDQLWALQQPLLWNQSFRTVSVHFCNYMHLPVMAGAK